VNRLYTPLLRRLYLLLGVVLVVYGAAEGVRHSAWYKHRLYRQLVTGNRRQKVYAATQLLDLRAQLQLLHALRTDSPATRDLATRALWELWFHAAGDQAYQLLQAAGELAANHDFTDALGVLNHVVRAYPTFAEGWNRRATLFWELGQYRRSIADCRKVVALNPDHFGAWQGMGLCQFLIGDLDGACRSLRAACRLTPYDPDTRRLLGRCEELLRSPNGEPQRVPTQLI
jgi:tetratricopeptide (TPR) repeat protein